MKTSDFRNFLIIILSLILGTAAAETHQTPQGGLYKSLYSDRSPPGGPLAPDSYRVFETHSLLMQPRKAKKAQRKQDAKEKKKKAAIKSSSREAQKRSYDIQSPEVQARMDKNKKDAASRIKAKKKNNKSKTIKGAKKYR